MHSTTSRALLYVDHGDYFRGHYILQLAGFPTEGSDLHILNLSMWREILALMDESETTTVWMYKTLQITG